MIVVMNVTHELFFRVVRKYQTVSTRSTPFLTAQRNFPLLHYLNNFLFSTYFVEYHVLRGLLDTLSFDISILSRM